MKNFRLLATFLVVALCVMGTSCGKDDDDGGKSETSFEIKATNVIDLDLDGSYGKIATVKAIGEYYESGYNYDEIVLAEATFQNKGFTLNLPKDVPATRLSLITESFGGGLTVSDENAKWINGVYILAYDKTGEELGGISFADAATTACVVWTYADRDVTVKGKIYGDNIDLNLKKGWNIVYMEDFDDYAMTTQKPANINLKWYYGGGS